MIEDSETVDEWEDENIFLDTNCMDSRETERYGYNIQSVNWIQKMSYETLSSERFYVSESRSTVITVMMAIKRSTIYHELGFLPSGINRIITEYLRIPWMAPDGSQLFSDSELKHILYEVNELPLDMGIYNHTNTNTMTISTVFTDPSESYVSFRIAIRMDDSYVRYSRIVKLDKTNPDYDKLRLVLYRMFLKYWEESSYYPPSKRARH